MELVLLGGRHRRPLCPSCADRYGLGLPPKLERRPGLLHFRKLRDDETAKYV